jgi:hypothetical protein
MKESHSPEKGQILGELDNLLYHESVDIGKVCKQRWHRSPWGQGLVMTEQVSWRLQRSEHELKALAL